MYQIVSMNSRVTKKLHVSNCINEKFFRFLLQSDFHFCILILGLVLECDMTDQIVTILSNFGFPICITLLLLYYIKTEQQKTNEQLQSIEKVIERNTTIIEIYLKKENIHEK